MTRPDEQTDFEPLWDYREPATTEARFREKLAEAASRTPSWHAQLLTQIARTQGLQRKFDEALDTLDDAAALLGEEMPRARVRYLLERGRVDNSSGKPRRARALFLEAMALAKASGEESLAIDAVHMLAIVEPNDKQLAWNLAALRMAEQAADPKARGWLGSLYNNIGWTYHDAGEHTKALELFERGLAWRREQKQPRETQIAAWCVARCLRSLGRVEEALARQRELVAELDAAGTTDGFVFEELGECLLALGKGEEARPWLAKAHTELAKDAWLAANEPARLGRLAELSS